MKKWQLLTAITFLILTGTACSTGTTISSAKPQQSKQIQKETDPFTKLAEETNKELKLVPLELTGYADIIGATLLQPVHQSFAVNHEFTVSGKIDKHEQLLGNFVWIKMKQVDTNEPNDTFEYYVPIEDGSFEQVIHFFNGAGNYSITILLPSTEQENFFSELANFEVINVNETIERDITYTPNGHDSGLVIHEPSSGMLEANELIPISGEIKKSAENQTVMLQLKKENDSWQHVLPVTDGIFSYNLPLFFGEGIHEVQIYVPDKELENRYQYGSSFLVNNVSTKRMEPIEFHRGYEERGIQLESPKYGGDQANLTYKISGKINPNAPSAKEMTHMYIKTTKGQDEALDIIPIQNFAFDDEIYLRFGPGDYEMTINIPEINQENTAYFSFHSVASLTVTNTANEDKRDLLPSRGIQSEAPEIIALANEITKDKKTNRDKAKAIYDYTAKNIAYDVKKFKNNDFKWDDGALKTIQSKMGVCQDYAYLSTALLRASGIEARLIGGKAGTGAFKENHAWVEANIDGDWLVMDPTWGAGFVDDDKFVAKYTDKYFDPNEKEFNETHIREKPEY
ncbi:transglutaminase domain-containing protein [Lederbergia citrea]|uniref:transglutaminase domain-containing protein n=1 Tax=Lederbergia citrea TaxID=2833581 RepID=UPI001BC8F9EA|nr:transglutaminase-like domain-containing protein [Lederbergia citrea]MBS4203321.1 transglutaminase domain-containing protein [Lederbergia citrea]